MTKSELEAIKIIVQYAHDVAKDRDLKGKILESMWVIQRELNLKSTNYITGERE